MVILSSEALSYFLDLPFPYASALFKENASLFLFDNYLIKDLLS